MEDKKLEEVVEQEPTQEPETQEQAPEPTPEPKADLSAVLEAIADLKQVVTTALTQIEPETVSTEVEEDETPDTDIPKQDVDEISKQLGF